MRDSDLAQRLAMIERLTKLYKPERIIHLVTISLALVLLLLVFVNLWRHDQLGLTELGILTGSGGLTTITGNQLFRMWDRALSIVAAPREKASNGA